MFKLFLALIILMSVTIFSEVPYNSLHESEMKVLDLFLHATYSEASVTCTNIKITDEESSETNIMITFNKPWKGADSFGELGGVLGAVGSLTNNTKWHSDYLIIMYIKEGYQSKMIVCTTSSARYFANNIDKWSSSQCISWIGKNLIVKDG